MRKAILLLLLVQLPLLLLAQGRNSTIDSSYEKEVKEILKNKAIQTVFELIKAQDSITLADHILLTEIEAPPFQEEKRAAQFLKMLVEIGVDSAWIDSVGNVIALRKGTIRNRTVALDAHLDTVFPEGTDVKVTIKGDTLLAPGIGDDTRGLAMVLAVLRAMNDAQIKTEADILFIGTVGEEGLGDLRGVKHLFSVQGPEIDSWISIDGGDLGRINYQALGSHRFGVSFRGPGGHSWGAFGLANPHHAMGKAISYFVEEADKFTRRGPKTSYNVGRVGGGTSVNSIPFVSWMEVDIRSVDPSRLDSMDLILKNAVQRAHDEQDKLRRQGRPLTVEVEMIGDRPSGELSPQLPLIQRALAATEHFGVSPHATRGSTNANIPIARGIPAVTIGRGGKGGWAHSLNEWWANKDGYKGIQYALLVLIAEAGLGGF